MVELIPQEHVESKIYVIRLQKLSQLERKYERHDDQIQAIFNQL